MTTPPLPATPQARLALVAVGAVLLLGLARCTFAGSAGSSDARRLAAGPTVQVNGVSILPTWTDTPPPITLTPAPTLVPTTPAPTPTDTAEPSTTPSPRPATPTPRRTAVAASGGSGAGGSAASGSSSSGRSGGSSGGSGDSGNRSGNDAGGSGGSGSGSPPLPSANPRPPLDSPAGLVLALRAGGLVVYQRHALTDWSQDPREADFGRRSAADPSLLGQCDAQRNLSPAGGDMARGLGAAWRRLGIHFGDVVSSPFCRCRETASLAASSPRLNSDLVDSGQFTWDEKRVKQLKRALKDEITAPVAAGSNRLIVGHMPNLKDLLGVALEEGESAVLEVDGSDIRVVRRVMAAEWAGFPTP